MRVRWRNTSRVSVVHDQVDVALAVARLGVGQPVPLVRQRPQRLRQQAQPLDLDRQLAGLRAEQRALGAEDVADVLVLERRVAVRTQRVLLQEQLDLAAHGPGSWRSWPCPSRA